MDPPPPGSHGHLGESVGPLRVADSVGWQRGIVVPPSEPYLSAVTGGSDAGCILDDGPSVYICRDLVPHVWVGLFAVVEQPYISCSSV